MTHARWAKGEPLHSSCSHTGVCAIRLETLPSKGLRTLCRPQPTVFDTLMSRNATVSRCRPDYVAWTAGYAAGTKSIG